ncbi:MAG: TonB-dependent receptor [Sphingobacteriaceae bacterium]|nr:TonB-dependent receptor [Cytophagaceae bacterium]
MINFLKSVIALGFLTGSALAQTPDSLRTTDLSEVVVEGTRPTRQLSLPDRHDGFLMAGKKSLAIPVGGMVANLAEKVGRQVFAKVPGVFVYDLDGAGNQLNIATRGLDPHRSWEFNVRQNGIITNSDMYGYPASHYSPPLESIERVELVHGTGALQYGAQFGGMVNYVSKQGDSTRRLAFESVNTLGSFGLLSSYNAVGGRIGKLRYYAYIQRRDSEGYRRNARSQAAAEAVSLTYDFSRKISLRLEWGHSTYLFQQPGPLTDSLFRADPRQATRSRNYYQPDIHVPSLTFRWQVGPRTALRLTSSALLGARSSVQVLASALVPDTVSRLTGQARPRQVDVDRFRSFTNELRLVHEYRLAGRRAVFVGGVQGMANRLHRQQLGMGSTSSDFDLRISGAWGRDLFFTTSNIAVFAENLVYLSPRLSLTTGARYEHGQTDLSGTIRYLPDHAVPNRIQHRFPLFGGTVQYRMPGGARAYAGISQAYRPVIFKDVIPASALERVDNNLRDNSGYVAELGLTGRLKRFLRYDVSLFHITYRNRLGGLFQTDATTGQPYVLRTNLGDTRTRGVEALLEATLLRRRAWSLSAFTSTAFIDGKYTAGTVNVSGENRSIVGNTVESVPQWTSRNGVELVGKAFQVSVQYSYVSDTFADPLNTVTPSRDGARGRVPGYGLLDVLASVRLTPHLSLKASLNNALDRSYFTKRPTFYPKPGIWPSDGRSANVTLGINL